MRPHVFPALLAAALACLLCGCTAMLDTDLVIEDDPITVSGTDPVEEAIRTWDEAHVPYTIAHAYPLDPAWLADVYGLSAEEAAGWVEYAVEPNTEGADLTKPVEPGETEMDWQTAANRADAVRRAIGFPAKEGTAWELTLYPAGARYARASFACRYWNTDTGDLQVELDSVTGALQSLVNNVSDTGGKAAAMTEDVTSLYARSAGDEDRYAAARDGINGSAAPLAELRRTMAALGAALGLPQDIVWNAVPNGDGTDSLQPVPQEARDWNELNSRWFYVIGLEGRAADGTVYEAELDRACGVLRSLRHTTQDAAYVEAPAP